MILFKKIPNFIGFYFNRHIQTKQTAIKRYAATT